ncbi:MAG TPA: gephyrin-like molybdotransferase Glp [Acidimicrobiales bacterium]|nr:gephyrin-like molybdotransferase Glp [Acidimicrobiales bacterium]
MIALDEAQREILDACAPLAPRPVPLLEAVGCVTADAVVTDENVPPFANTAMDGYAVRAADTTGAPVRLEVVATLAAGMAPAQAVGPGQAIRIMTGAPMPPGADAVVMVERTRAEDGGGAVVVEVSATPGDHVRAAGEDLRAGQVVFGPGTVLGPGHVGVLATLGCETVTAVPRPRVGVLSTGDELVSGPQPLRAGQIRDANRPMLLALVNQSGFEAVDLGVVRDDEAVLTGAVQDGVAECDALVTTGGVSVGDFDYMKGVLDRLGRMHWWQVAIKPAKPLAFGLVGSVPVFGLPGNPVSSMVSFELFARPALRRMGGHADTDRPRVAAVADEPLRRRSDGKLHLMRVVASEGDDGRWHVRSSGGQASHLLRAMALANALALLPDGEGVGQGQTVETMLLS